MVKGNYNVIAPFYDRLSRIVFGDSIVNAQNFLVDRISANSTILIVGGGTGWILEEISKKQPTGLHISYIDVSEKMIELSRKRNIGTNEVVFLCSDIKDADLKQMVDIVITPFFLDNFSAGTAAIVFDKIHRCLAPGGLWLFSDFQISGRGILWQKVLLKAMYFFFKSFCNIEANKLPDTPSFFSKKGYKIVSSKSFFKNFICSIIYRKHEV